MQPIMANLAALAVALLFYLWRGYYQAQQRRRRILCRRVANLLWAVAEQTNSNDSALSST